MGYRIRKLASAAAPVLAGVALVTASVPEASAAEKYQKAACVAVMPGSRYVKLAALDYYTVPSKTTLRHTDLVYMPTSKGVKRNRRDFYIESWVTDGSNRTTQNIKRGDMSLDTISSQVGWKEDITTKRGKTRLFVHGWVNLNEWPTECEKAGSIFY
ncbi:hypothetical protein ACFVZM_05425 [Streptomyces sioyaensis]|uniref:hypothetical protein n=1 Tax=Streptomyces sioyaensis TaxID=67364 RepID=UPI0036AE8998